MTQITKAALLARVEALEKSLKREAAERKRLEKTLADSLEQQTATSEILRVISQSPSDVQPVFDAIVTSAVRLLRAHSGALSRIAGDQIDLAALTSTDAAGDATLRARFPQSLHSEGPHAQVIRARVPLNTADVQSDPRMPEATRAMARARGYRSVAVVPLLRHDEAVGAIAVTRREPGGFTDDEIALLQTFADQAVIAIENVRLFNETKEALEQQTATSEILRVISSSATDVQPVFEAIADSAMRLFGAWGVLVWRSDGELVRLAAARGGVPGTEAMLEEWRNPWRAEAGSPLDRSLRSRAMQQIVDAETDESVGPIFREAARERGTRSAIWMPMLRGDEVVGVISVSRARPGPFAPAEIALLQTFADQAIIAIENARLFNELEGRNRDLTATAEILRVISSSPTDVQPVFDTIVEGAARLCQAAFSTLLRFDGQMLTFEAQHGMRPEQVERARQVFPEPPGRHMAVGRAVLDRRVAHIEDIHEDPEYRVLAHQEDYYTVLAVPLVREGVPVGALGLWRREVRPFSDQQIELLKTFADQAVIAIENVRLFTELQEKNRALTMAHAQVAEALEQRTATSEILRVIASSPTDVQPVFDVVLASGVSLCGASFGGVFRFDGELVHLVTSYEWPAEQLEAVRRHFPMPPGDGSLAARAIRDRRVVQTPDYAADSLAGSLPPWVPGGEQRPRSTIAIPMLREGSPVGAIVLARSEAGLFSDKHIALLKTFADQAVIAIENVRLFTELQHKNEALTQAHAQVTEALEQQTATSDILRVISQSQTDAQPVFETIVRNAVRLCGAIQGGVYRFDGELVHAVAHEGFTPQQLEDWRRNFPRPVTALGTINLAIRTRTVVRIDDIEADPSIMSTGTVANLRSRGSRSTLAVPMIRQGDVIGAIALAHREVAAFSNAHVELLKTFADQAVIAIENVRLFKELEARTQDLTRSVGELQALGEVGQAISSTLDLRTVLSTIVVRATQLSGTDAGVIYEYDEQREVFVPRATEHLETDIVETMLTTPVRKGEGATGRLAEIQEPVQVPDILEAPAESRVRGALVHAGYRALLAVPLVREDHLLGGLTVIRKVTGAFAPEVIELLRTFATQSALAIQNARLFLEIEDKSRQLELASQHKSEFLANMSHELRTPLNAIIGYSEMLQEEAQDLHQDAFIPDLENINAAAKHQLSLINDMLDLSKIEAGRMELELTDFHLPTALDNALTLVRERAARRGITLRATIDPRLGDVRADERKIKQVVLNLLSNAIKFTPEGGRIDVRAVPVDSSVEVSVSDTGVGIAPEDQEAVFEEFRQVGVSATKHEGTGLGLTLTKKFVELHGGRTWVESELGRGATFIFTLPIES